MAGRNGRWKKGLFPIDENMIEKLIEQCHGGRHDCDLPEEDETRAIEADDDGDLVWYLEVTLSDTTPGEPDEHSANRDAVAWSDEYAVNMRVLTDYLQRRMANEPDPIPPTLH